MISGEKFRDFYISCSALISSCSYIFYTSFNHISANFETEKKRDALTSSHFMRKDYF